MIGLVCCNLFALRMMQSLSGHGTVYEPEEMHSKGCETLALRETVGGAE